MIDQSTKEQIKNELAKYVTHSTSANKAATKLEISGATISKILNHSFDGIADGMWLRIAKALGIFHDTKWMHADTKPAKKLTHFFDDAKLFGNVFGLVCTPGAGKTDTLDFYLKCRPNVYYVKCIADMNQRDFLHQLITSMAIKGTYRTAYDMLQAIKRHVDETPNPVIIWDELEKGKNALFLLFIDIYNLLWKRCGIVLIGTHNLKGRIELGNERGYIGFNEVYSRLGGKLNEIPMPDYEDGALVAQTNGVDDPIEVARIVNGSSNKQGIVDMRRIERLVHAYKQKQAAQAEMEVTA